MADKSLLIIIPAYNEEQNIGAFLDQLCQSKVVEEADILVVNDASTDRTAEIARSKGCAVVTGIYNLGYGSGLQIGYKYAQREGYPYVIQMDADGQHDPCNVEALYQKLLERDAEGNRPDIVLGSRFMKGSITYRMTTVRRLACQLFQLLIFLGTGRSILDPTTGLQGFSRRAYSFYAKYNHFDDKYPDANMLMQMLLLGFRVAEIPAVMHPRLEGVSMHSGLKPVLYMFRMMFSLMAVWIRIKLFHMDIGGMDEELVS